MARFFLKPLMIALLVGATLNFASANLANKARNFIIEHEIEIPAGFDLFQNNYSYFGGEYKIGFKKHHSNINKYYRHENLNINAALRANLGGHATARFGPEVRASFVRPFFRRDLLKRKTQDGFIVSLYGPGAAPHTAAKAKKLRAGEYYFFTARLAFQVSAAEMAAQGMAFAGPYATYVVAGDFQFQVYRKANNRVRVRASALKNKTFQVGASVRVIPDLELVSSGTVNDVINNVLEFTPFDWKIFSSSKGSVYTMEFNYNLTDLKGPAAKAYNKLMDISQYKVNDLAALNPIRDHQGNRIRSILAGKIDLSEAASQQAGSGVEKGVVSSATYNRHGNSLSMDLHLLANYKTSKNFLEMDYTATMGTDPTIHRYKIASILMTKEYRLGKDWKEAQRLREATMIFKNNRSGQITDFEEMNVTYQRSDVVFKQKDCKDLCKVLPFLLKHNEVPTVVGQARKILPDEWFGEYQIGKRIRSATNKEMLLNMDVFYGPKALKLIQNLSEEDIRAEVNGYYLIYNLNKEINNNRDYFGKPRPHMNQAKNIANKLIRLLKAPRTAAGIEAAWKQLKGLKRHRGFRNAFSGIIVRLVELGAAKTKNVDLEDVMSVDFNLQIIGAENHVFTIGKYKQSDFNKALIMDRNRILNRDFDPRNFE